MKILHTADIHLDSPLNGVADPSGRRLELLSAMANIAKYADNCGAAAVIVAGDLFDEKNVSEKTVRGAAEIIRGCKAAWFVLKGNHGGGEAYDLLRSLCPQARFFGEEWTRYDLGNVTVCGRELGSDDAEHWRTLQLDPARYNILTLHGDVDDASYGLIDRNALAQSGAKYVALGHRHSFAEYRFGRVRACYSGVPEPRGFDEGARTGFVEIDTDADVIRFVPQAIRSVVSKSVDVGGADSDVILERRILDAVADVDLRNYLDISFCGELATGLHLSAVVKNTLENKFFALRVKDNTRAKADLAALVEEVSLRGEFVKRAMQIPDEKMRSDVLKLGLAALSGEELQ